MSSLGKDTNSKTVLNNLNKWLFSFLKQVQIAPEEWYLLSVSV